MGVGVGPEGIPSACSSAPNAASNAASAGASTNVGVLAAASAAAAESSTLSCSNASVVCMMAVASDALELIDSFNAAWAASWGRVMRACHSNSSSVRFCGAAVDADAARVVASGLVVVALAVGNAVGLGFGDVDVMGWAVIVAAVEARWEEVVVVVVLLVLVMLVVMVALVIAIVVGAISQLVPVNPPLSPQSHLKLPLLS